MRRAPAGDVGRGIQRRRARRAFSRSRSASAASRSARSIAAARCSGSSSDSPASSAARSCTGRTCSRCARKRATSDSDAGSRSISGKSSASSARRSSTGRTIRSIARNAHLNFNRLGVRLAEYVEDMYGITDSVLHGGIPTDRLDRRLADARRGDRPAAGGGRACYASADCQQAPIVDDRLDRRRLGRRDSSALRARRDPGRRREPADRGAVGEPRSGATQRALRRSVGARRRLHRQRVLTSTRTTTAATTS